MNYMGVLILGVNTLYRLFCFFKLFLMVGKGLKLFFNNKKTRSAAPEDGCRQRIDYMDIKYARYSAYYATVA